MLPLSVRWFVFGCVVVWLFADVVCVLLCGLLCVCVGSSFRPANLWGGLSLRLLLAAPSVGLQHVLWCVVAVCRVLLCVVFQCVGFCTVSVCVVLVSGFVVCPSCVCRLLLLLLLMLSCCCGVIVV